MDIQSTLGTAGEALKSIFKSMTNEAQMSLLNCLQCQQHCEAAIRHCLEHGGLHSETKHIQILRDAAQICNATSEFMLRESSSVYLMCKICAEICLRCAHDCDRFLHDEVMKSCAESCRRCAESCVRISLNN